MSIDNELKNIFVFRSQCFFTETERNVLQAKLLSQIKTGAVLLPNCVTLEAVTGPCTDVEVKIIKEDEQ